MSYSRDQHQMIRDGPFVLQIGCDEWRHAVVQIVGSANDADVRQFRLRLTGKIVEYAVAQALGRLGGGLRLLTAVEKTDAFGDFLKTRMVRALESEDPTELHYLLAQLDDYYSYMWRYYKKLAKDRADRMNPGV